MMLYCVVNSNGHLLHVHSQPLIEGLNIARKLKRLGEGLFQLAKKDRATGVSCAEVHFKRLMKVRKTSFIALDHVHYFIACFTITIPLLLLMIKITCILAIIPNSRTLWVTISMQGAGGVARGRQQIRLVGA